MASKDVVPGWRYIWVFDMAVGEAIEVSEERLAWFRGGDDREAYEEVYSDPFMVIMQWKGRIGVFHVLLHDSLKT